MLFDYEISLNSKFACEYNNLGLYIKEKNPKFAGLQGYKSFLHESMDWLWAMHYKPSCLLVLVKWKSFVGKHHSPHLPMRASECFKQTMTIHFTSSRIWIMNTYFKIYTTKLWESGFNGWVIQLTCLLNNTRKTNTPFVAYCSGFKCLSLLYQHPAQETPCNFQTKSYADENFWVKLSSPLKTDICGKSVTQRLASLCCSPKSFPHAVRWMQI